MNGSSEIETAARRFNNARTALLQELDNPNRENHRYGLLVAELSNSIEAYLRALRGGSRSKESTATAKSRTRTGTSRN